jgi:hypothetical protein
MISTFLMRTRVVAVFLLVVGCCANGNPAPAPPPDSVPGKVGSSLPDILGSVLPEIKAKTSVPVLLPAELPTLLGDAKHAKVEKVLPDEYAIALLRVRHGRCWLRGVVRSQEQLPLLAAGTT